MQHRNSPDHLMSVEQVAAMLGVSRRTVWRWASEQPEFPKPAVLGRKLTRWRARDVRRFARLSMGESQRRAHVARRRFRPYAANGRQIAFAKHYAESGNATRAAIAAGYSARSAATIGYENLRRPAVRIQLAKEKDNRPNRPDKPSKDDVLTQLGNLYDADIAGMFEANGSVKPIAEWPALARSILVRKMEIKKTVKRGPKGMETLVEITSLALQDRLKVLRMIGDHTEIRAFDPNTTELKRLQAKLHLQELMMLVLDSERRKYHKAYEKLKAETGRAKPA